MHVRLSIVRAVVCVTAGVWHQAQAAYTAGIFSDTYGRYPNLVVVNGVREDPLEWLVVDGAGAPGDEAHGLRVDLEGRKGFYIANYYDKPIDNFTGGTLRFSLKTSVAVWGVCMVTEYTWGGKDVFLDLGTTSTTAWQDYSMPLQSGSFNAAEFLALRFEQWSNTPVVFYLDNIRVEKPDDSGIGDWPDPDISNNEMHFNLNPVIHEGSADPSVRVFDGVVYVYPSHDLKPENTTWTMKDWKVYSTTDLNRFTDHGVIFDDNWVTWISRKDACWAPDAVRFNNRYYFYFCSGGAGAIGVAVADKAEGPFTDALGRALIPQAEAPNYLRNIDPGAFIDDDGTPYLFWGNGGCFGGRLNSDMTSFAAGPQQIAVQNNIGYAEGPFVFKRNGIYYLTYSRSGSSGYDHIDYATAQAPLGPYTFRGAIIGHGKKGNIHGSVFEYRGQWYVAYHDFEEHDKYRKTCFEYIHFNDDGTIDEVSPTKRGVAKFDGAQRIPAENYFDKSPEISYRQGEEDFVVTGLAHGRFLVYPKIDFGAGMDGVTLRASCGAPGSAVELRLNTADGDLLGTVPLTHTGGLDIFTSHTASIGGLSSIRDVVLRFTGPAGTEIGRFDWMEFSGGSGSTRFTVRSLPATNGTLSSVMALPGGKILISSRAADERIRQAHMYSLAGALLRRAELAVPHASVTFEGVRPGSYMVMVETESGRCAARRLMVR